MLNANQAINQFFALTKREIKAASMDVLQTAKGEMPLTYAFRTPVERAAYDQAVMNKTTADFQWGAGSLSYRRMAGIGLGAYGAVNSTYRLASGGSLYRDSNGNTDMIGLPLI